MPVEIAWYQAPSVVMMKLRGVVSLQDYQAATHVLFDWATKLGSAKIHLIIDATELSKLPSIDSLTQIPLNEVHGHIVAVAQIY